MKRFLSYFHPKLPIFLAYMLQQVEYNPHKFIKWAFRFPQLTSVMHRQQLTWTLKAKLLVAVISGFWLFYLAVAAIYFYFSPLLGVLTVLISPFMTILVTYFFVLAVWLYIEEPRRSSLLKKATKKFKQHPGIKVAILGSYGKTSMKELLLTVLSEGKTVAATPGNKNVPISHASWVKRLSGDEDILLIEYGEGAPGDIKKLAKLSQPDYAVITGLAPNHLDEYKDLAAVEKDLLSIQNYVPDSSLFVNAEAEAFDVHSIETLNQYTRKTVLGWKITDIVIDVQYTQFTMKKAKYTIVVKSALLGEHQVGPLAFVAAFAYDQGITIKQIETGLAKTKPYDHRMQSRNQHGAWIIDDTYNGSLEGIKAGTALLGKLSAKRKIYVTPGLVDQGVETERVHIEIGQAIAQAQPDIAILMQNSTTEFIVRGLEVANFTGELRIQADPLTFYTNLEHIVAAGDLVVMQNDWTDNYA